MFYHVPSFTYLLFNVYLDSFMFINLITSKNPFGSPFSLFSFHMSICPNESYVIKRYKCKRQQKEKEKLESPGGSSCQSGSSPSSTASGGGIGSSGGQGLAAAPNSPK